MFENIIEYFLPRWNIGFVDPEAIFSHDELKVTWMKHPYKGRWFADPFVLDVTDDEILLLVEEYIISRRKGRLALLTVDRNGYRLKSSEVVLETDTHLSFPYIWRKDGEIYVMPEMCGAEICNLYIYDPQSRKLVPKCKLCDGSIVDPVIFNNAQGTYIIHGYSLNRKIKIMHFDTENLCLDRQVRELETPGRTSQNAGAIIERDGRMYRVAQDGNNGYGNGLLIQRIDHAEDIDRMEFATEYRHYPAPGMYRFGMHTFNSYKGVGVTDGKGYGSKIVSSMISMIPKGLIVKTLAFILPKKKDDDSAEQS